MRPFTDSDSDLGSVNFLIVPLLSRPVPRNNAQRTPMDHGRPKSFSELPGEEEFIIVFTLN